MNTSIPGVTIYLFLDHLLDHPFVVPAGLAGVPDQPRPMTPAEPGVRDVEELGRPPERGE